MTLNFGKTTPMVSSAQRTYLMWIAAYGIGALAISWIALVNGFPMMFADSGSYIAVGTELAYVSDRSVTYGLLIAPFTYLIGLWGPVVLQALTASWLIGEVVVVIINRRSPTALLLILIALAAISSLPWFIGQIMPDLATSLIPLILYLILFSPVQGWIAWFRFVLLTGLITLHLSHLPITAGLIGIAGALLVLRQGWHSMLRRITPAVAALMFATVGLCTITYFATGAFRPSMESSKFLVAKLFDSKLGQPVLNRLCITETWRLCKARSFVEDPRRDLHGQDYLWASDSPRLALQRADPVALRAEEGAFARRVFQEDFAGVLRIAVISWRDQLTRARAADGMITYPERFLVTKQIHSHFPVGSASYESSMQQRGDLQKLAIMPDRVIALIILLLTPIMIWRAVRKSDDKMLAFITMVLSTIVVNAAVCGILSGPVDRYQSRVLWLLPLLGLVGLAKIFVLISKPSQTEC